MVNNQDSLAIETSVAGTHDLGAGTEILLR